MVKSESTLLISLESLKNKLAKPPVAITSISMSISLLILEIIPSNKPIYPQYIPDCIADTVSFPIIELGFFTAILGSLAVALSSESKDNSIPGAMTQPKYDAATRTFLA